MAAGEPTPAAAGTVQSMTITALTPGTTYYFAVKTADEVPNYSSLSNVVSGQTDTDEIAPAAVDSLAAGNPTAGSIALTWTAPGDDASTGTAASYDIRYCTVTINDSNWAGATQVSGEPTPAAAGTVQGMTVTGLAADTMYYFAMKTADEVSNVSALSNIASGRTLEFGGTLQVTPATVTFTGLAGTANPAPRDVTVENTGAATIHWTAAVRAPAPAWVSLTNPTGTGNGTFIVNVNWQGLPVGTHTAYVDVTDPQATNSPQTVTVVCDLHSGQQVVALKRDAGLTAGGAIDSRFDCRHRDNHHRERYRHTRRWLGPVGRTAAFRPCPACRTICTSSTCLRFQPARGSTWPSCGSTTVRATAPTATLPSGWS